MKQLKDYLHFYLGCECIAIDDDGRGFRDHILSVEYHKKTLQFISGGIYEWGDVSSEDLVNIKPLLRPLRDLKAEDFYSFGLAGKGQILINATVNGMWCSGLYEVKEYDERIEDELSVDPKDLLYQLEESDFDNVLSCTKTGQIAYGTSDEMRYFVELETLSKWVNHLRERRIDVDGLIKDGLAIDATTYADERSVATTDSQS